MKRLLWLLGAFALTFPCLTQATERNIPDIHIITRAEWWADESIRFLTKSKAEIAAENAEKDKLRLLNLKATNPTAYQAELKKREQAQATAAKNAKISAERTAFMKKNFPNDWTYDLTRDKQGEYYLLYQDQIKNHKTKLVVHHTAMEYDTHRTEAEIRASLQRIYTYHTIDRDFGDIGYNFLIDHLGNIYEGRAGGEGAVGMHVAYNNIASVGISLMGNFEETQPTQAQIDALTDLLTALAKKYHIDPNAQESYFQPSSSSPYMTVKTLPTIVGHGDIAPTACPGEHLHILLPFIRTEVSKRLQGNSPSEIFSRDGEIAITPDSSATSLSDFSAKLKKIQTTQPELLEAVVQVVRDRYQGTLPKATNGMEKLVYKWTLDVLKNIFWSTSDEIPSGIPVLLYELTTQYKTYEVKCETSSCFVDIDHQLTHFWPFQATFTLLNDEIIIQSEQLKVTKATYILISAGEDTVQITNYDRTSYAGIPRNIFHDSLIFQKDVYKTLSWAEHTGYVVINQVSPTNYLKWIVETNDQEHLEKNKVMALLAKNYLLFYLNKKNIHPSIPESASYVAIDSPELFQKYVGAGAEKTLTKRYKALEATKNQVVLYSWTLPILPYFSCSAGFTLSAAEKRGWKDTPYLQSVFDFSACKDFEGHGVGLAGKGAEYFAQKGMKAEEILQRYYPGVEVVEINS